MLIVIVKAIGAFGDPTLFDPIVYCNIIPLQRGQCSPKYTQYTPHGAPVRNKNRYRYVAQTVDVYVMKHGVAQLSSYVLSLFTYKFAKWGVMYCDKLHGLYGIIFVVPIWNKTRTPPWLYAKATITILQNRNTSPW